MGREELMHRYHVHYSVHVLGDYELSSAKMFLKILNLIAEDYVKSLLYAFK